MARCDMCGKEASLVLAEIEGTRLQVCSNCGSHGKVLKRISNPTPVRKNKRVTPASLDPETIQTLVENYGMRIKQAREKLNLTQEELGRKINEKTSLIHALESEHREPQIDRARKIEKFLHIQLIEERELKETTQEISEEGPLTIGDMIKIKKK